MKRTDGLWSCVARALLLALAMTATSLASAAVHISDVFTSGQGPNYYRIPSLAVAPNGNLVAFAEGRQTPADPGSGYPIELVSKVSTNGGATWSSLKVIASSSQFSYSDPRSVVDAATGNIFTLFTQWPKDVGSTYVPPGLGSNSSVVCYVSSSNNGLSWSGLNNINSQVKDPAWSTFLANSGAGIQLRWQGAGSPAPNGRLVVPAYLYDSTATCWNLSLYSDNHGATWTHSAIAPTPADENQVIELTNGDLMMDSRQLSSNYRERFISHDGGAAWSAMPNGDVPVTPVNCGLLRYSAKRDGGDRDRILFSGPLGNPVGSGSGRYNMGVWTSYDEGKTFINPVRLDSGDNQYSTMFMLPDWSIGVLYEANGYTETRLAKFALADLESQTPSPHLQEYDGFGNNIDRARGGIGWSGSWIGGSPTNAYAARLNSTGLTFAGSTFPTESGRIDLTPGHTTAERQLATPINLNSNSTTYVSLLVSQALDAGPTLTGKPVNVQLRDSSEASRVSFGVNSNEIFYVSNPNGAVQTAPGTVAGSASYLLLLKITAEDAGQTGNFDQIFFKTFQSGVDPIPLTDAGLGWTLVGSTAANSSAILDRIALVGGSAATWSLDELRIGDSFGAVASNVEVPEPGTVGLLASGATLLLGLRRRRVLVRRW
jgi:sialidase-1